MPSKPNYSKLPTHIQYIIKEYIEKGTPPGNFLTAVIQNKLKESFIYADDINLHRMFDIVNFFYNEAPIGCWGSEKRMENWMKEGGLKGRWKSITADESDSSLVDP